MSTQITISPEIKLVVNTTPITGGSAGQILFQTTGNTVGESSNLVWDNAKNIAGIGTNAPFSGATNVISSLQLGASASNLNVGGFCSLGKITVNGYGAVGSNYYLDSNNFLRRTNSDSVSILDFSAAGFYFRNASSGGANTTIALNELASIRANGNVLINTVTDAGFRLDVNGTTRIKGIGTTVSTTAFIVQDNIGTTYFTIKDDGQLSSSGTDTGIYSNFTTGNKSPLLFSHSGYGTATPNDTRIDIGYRGRQPGGLNSYDFFTYKVYQGSPDTNVITGFEFYTHQNQGSSLPSQLAMAINGGNVGIGTSSPARRIDILGSGDVLTGLKTTSATGAAAHVVLNDINSNFEFGMWGSTRTGYGAINANNAYIFGAVDFAITSNSNIKFGAGPTPSERMRIVGGTGNVLINTTTDAGFRLDVNGTARIQGTTTLNDVATCLQGLRVNGGYTAFNASTILGSASQSGNTFNFSTQYIGGATGATNYFNFSGTLASGTGGSFNVFNVQQTFSNTNSSQTFRGFYYNPNITGLQAGTAHFAIHTTSGRVRFEGLPTSSAGLSSGDIWNDGGTLKIV